MTASSSPPVRTRTTTTSHGGLGAIRAQAQNWFDAFPDLRLEPMEIRANGDRAFVWTHLSGHGADSGIAMDMELVR